MRIPLVTCAVLALCAPCRASDADEWPTQGAEDRRAGDADDYARLREAFFKDARPDPLHDKYEELFGEPWPEPGFHQFSPTKPFSEVRKFNAAFDLRGAAGARVETRAVDGRERLEILLPGSAGRTLEVRVDGEKVAISLPSTAPPARWRVRRSEEHLVPLPRDVDMDTVVVECDRDAVVVNYERRRAAPGESSRRIARWMCRR